MRSPWRGTAVSGVATPLAAEAQQTGEVRRFGFLSASALSPRSTAPRQELRERGYVEAKICLLGGDSLTEDLLFSELVRSQREIVTVSIPAARSRGDGGSAPGATELGSAEL